MQQPTAFNWTSAALNAFDAFESSQNVAAQQPAITIPQSAYSPMSFQAQFLDFGVLPNEPRTAVNFNQLEASMMMPQPMDSRAPWDAFTLAQGFSTNDEYGDTSLYGEEEPTFQYIKFPSKATLPIVPIYDNNSPLYPEHAMPLTIKHSEFTQQQQNDKSSGDWASLIMEDVGRLEAMSTHQNAAPPRPALTLQSPSDLHSQAQARLQQPHHFVQQQQARSSVKSEQVDEIYEATAFLHDFIAEDRLNNGVKEMVSLPSGLPAIPSLSVRTPAPRIGHAHPYSSPRMSTMTSPRLATGMGVGGLERRASRSVRPIVRVKREPAPLNTAYLAGLRRPIPLSALERTPQDPYPRSHGITYPLSIGSNATNGIDSTSTVTTSPPSESPFSSSNSLMSGTFDSPMTQRASIVGAPPSPTKENAVPMSAGEGSLRLHRGNSGREQNRPSTAERLQTQIRATASRKRADDDLISISFRNEEDWRRRAVLDNILAAKFLADNVMEPNNIGPSDPLAMGMGAEGKSIYAVFLEQVERSQWRCLFGDKDHPCGSHTISFKRLERALDHVRSHLNHRPFVCRGECQKGESCDARFFARSHLQDHVKRTESACCDTCGQVIRIQNMPRHRMAH